uniref:Heat shock 70 kDa protein 14 n=1 Tax=Mesocestoides corti TaxID=53468 RepID=A0A5K3FFZ7_MESCO
MRSCEKLKQALCLTTQEVRQRVDCQVTTSDITIAMDRSCFETLTEALIHRARKTMQKALQDANLSNVTMVEAIGGSVRIPAVQVIITDVFGVKPSCKLNPDQTVARGCGLMALKMTKGYSLKSFSVIDMPSIRVYVNGKVQQGVLRVPSSKCWHIQFKHLGVKISEIPATLSTNSGIRFKISPENFRQPFLKKLLIKIISAPLRGTSIESDWIVDNNGVVSCVKFVRPDYEDTKVDVCTNYLSLECISSLRKRQDDYEIQAREKKEQKVKLNMFESCIYDAMNNLSMKPNYNKELYPLLEAALKWISSEGIRAPLQDVENRFSLTNNLIHKFEEYLQELEKTQEIIQSAFKDFDEILMKEGRKGKMSVTQILLEEIENERKDVVAYGTLIEKLVNISAGPRQLRSGLFNEVPCPEVEEASEIGYDESEKKGIRNWREISLTFQKSERDRFKDDFQRCCLSGSLDEMKNLLQYVKASDQHYSNIQKLISMLHYVNSLLGVLPIV